MTAHAEVDDSWNCLSVKALCLDTPDDVCRVRSRRSQATSRRASLDETCAVVPNTMLRRFRVPTFSIGSIFRRRSKPSEGGSRFFGRELHTLCQPDLPQELHEMLLALYKRGPSAKQIFRRSAQQGKCQDAKQKLNTGVNISFDNIQLTVTAALLKEFLRSLPDCLLTCGHYKDWISITENDDKEKCKAQIKSLVDELPPSNQLLLRHLVCVLRHICDNCTVNEMTSYNMAVCVGQCLLWPSNAGQQPCDLHSARKVIDVVQQMIDGADEIFGGACLHLYADATTDDPVGLQCEQNVEEASVRSVEASVSTTVNADVVHSYVDEDSKTGEPCSVGTCGNVNVDTDMTAAAESMREPTDTSTSSCSSSTLVDAEDVVLRSSHGSVHVADSGFVDDGDSCATTGTPVSFFSNFQQIVSDDCESPPTLEDAKQQIQLRHPSRDSWDDSAECGTEIEYTDDDADSDRSTIDRRLMIRRRIRGGSAELLCRTCGLRNLRGSKARRRFSLPICIRICRCHSGMTSDGSDLFPSRIIGKNIFLPTVFEDDVLADAAEETPKVEISGETERHTAAINENLSSQQSDAGVTSSSQVDDFQNALSEPSHETLLTAEHQSQQSSTMSRNPPSYAEAILHKALRSAQLSESQRNRAHAALLKLKSQRLIRRSLSAEPTLDTSSTNSGIPGYSAYWNSQPTFHQNPVSDAVEAFDGAQAVVICPPPPYGARKPVCLAAGGVDETGIISRLRPPPAYDTAIRWKHQACGEVNVATTTDNATCSWAPSSNENEQPKSSIVARESLEKSTSPMAETVLSGKEPSEAQGVVLSRDGETNVDCSNAVESNTDLTECVDNVSSGYCTDGSPATEIDKEFSKPFNQHDSSAQSNVEVVPNNCVNESSSLGFPSSAVDVKGNNSRNRRAAKRRSIHSSSDTQIESVIGKLVKLKQVGVHRSVSDSSATVTRSRSVKDNKENIYKEHGLFCVRKRLCADVENTPPLNQQVSLTGLRSPDSNNNQTNERTTLSTAGPIIQSDLSKRQVLRVKNHEWYRKLVRQYSSESTSSTEAIECCAPSSNSSQKWTYQPTIVRDAHDRLNRTSSADQRRPSTRMQRSLGVRMSSSRDLMRHLGSSGGVCKEQIKVTWSVSKLREKYSGQS